MNTNGTFEHDTYTVRRQAFKLFGGVFRVFDPQGGLALYCKLKAFKLKEDIRIFSDEAMTNEVLSIQARSIIDFGAAYDVVDSADGEKIGALRRKGWKSSLVRDEWILLDPNDEDLGVVQEDSTIKALARRNVPLMNLLLPQSYNGTVGGAPVFGFKQHFNPFVLQMSLDFTPDTERLLDRRLGIAAAILLCAIEGRQQN